MKIAVLNSGSSSIKFSLFEMDTKTVIAKLTIEEIGKSSATITLIFDTQKIEKTCVIEDHKKALEKVVTLLASHHILKDFSTLDAIGHRVVHGGEEFVQATHITDEVLEKIEALNPLAPLHNPANLLGIRTAISLASCVPQIAVFDTAFHATLPQEAYLYALEFGMYEQHHIRKYGFHGTSHSYVLKRCAQELGKEVRDVNMISLHLGNGASACAIKGGKSIDTSMGFTPLEGLVMGSRCGDLDPAVVLYMQRTLGMGVDEIDTLLNKSSGLYGISGESDVRMLQERNDQKAKLALKMMVRRIQKYIGSYMALLGHVDAIVFTAGIGEHSSVVREMVLEDFGWGIALDHDANDLHAKKISLTQSEVALYVLPTDEELEIAKQSKELLEV
jgi:acetate kinase